MSLTCVSLQVSRGSENEEAYASPTIPLVGEDIIFPVPASDRRRRRTRGSSSDESDTQASNGIINEDLRVGGPYLCSVPTQTTHFTPGQKFHGLLERNNCGLHLRILKILTDAGIIPEELVLCLRQSVYNPEPKPTPTVFIIAQRCGLSVAWLNACKSILSLLQRKRIRGVSVEIADPRAFDPQYYHPLHPSDDIFKVWDEVMDTILNSNDISYWNSLSCLRIGTSSDWRKNPPTVLVTVDKSREIDWKPTREAIVGILEHFDLPMVAVKIVRDEIVFHSPTITRVSLPQNALQPKVHMGYSIGIQQVDGADGTFGGWIQLQDPGNGQWSTFGITCSHCVIPSEEHTSNTTLDVSDTERWRTYGIRPGDKKAENLLTVNTPSWKDMETEIDELSDQIARIESDPRYEKVNIAHEQDEFVIPRDERNWALQDSERQEYLSARTTIESFRNSNQHHLGNVFACSGERIGFSPTIGLKRYKTIFDWALIKVIPQRIGDNKIATLGQPMPRRVFPFDPDDRLLDRNLNEVALYPQERVFKCGRATGYTTGEYGGIRAALVSHKIIDNKRVSVTTLEHFITGDFSGQGDSGSLIFDRSCYFVGLLFAGNERSRITYFTHARDLFEDIAFTTNAKAVRILP